jgi:hypothetical protein
VQLQLGAQFLLGKAPGFTGQYNHSRVNGGHGVCFVDQPNLVKLFCNINVFVANVDKIAKNSSITMMKRMAGVGVRIVTYRVPFSWKYGVLH